MTHDDHNGGWIIVGMVLCGISGAIVGCVAGWVVRGLL